MDVREFCRVLVESNFGPFMGIPCSILKPLINYIEDSSSVKYYLTSSEGEAMGLAAGFTLSKKTPVVMMQNDGYGNAVNPLSSLQLLYRLPCLLVITWRGEPSKKDAPQHEVMGRTLLNLLSDFEIPYKVLEDDLDKLKKDVEEATLYTESRNLPFAFIVRKGYFSPYQSKGGNVPQDLYTRLDYLKVLEKNIDEKDILIGATGYCGREMHQSLKHKNKIYMMGSMGCAVSIGLGLAQEHPQRKIFVLDGDGALLMKMGTLSTVGYFHPSNLFHICFDNQMHESTGGQKTASPCVKFTDVAMACNYGTSFLITSPDEFKQLLDKIKNQKGPHFIHIKIKAGTLESLGRPCETPEEMKSNLMKSLVNG